MIRTEGHEMTGWFEQWRDGRRAHLIRDESRGWVVLYGDEILDPAMAAASSNPRIRRLGEAAALRSPTG